MNLSLTLALFGMAVALVSLGLTFRAHQENRDLAQAEVWLTTRADELANENRQLRLRNNMLRGAIDTALAEESVLPLAALGLTSTPALEQHLRPRRLDEGPFGGESA